MTSEHLQSHCAESKRNSKKSTECERTKTPFLLFFTDDYLQGTQDLPPDQQGFYTRCLFLMWDQKSGIPDDERWLSRRFGWHVLMVRRLRAALIEARKLKSVDGFLVNGRMMRDIARWLAADAKKPRKQAPAQPEVEVDAQPSTDPDQNQQQFDFGATAQPELAEQPEASCQSTGGSSPRSSPRVFANSQANSTDAPAYIPYSIPKVERESPVERTRAIAPIPDEEPPPPDPALLIRPDQHLAILAIADTFGQPGVMVLRPEDPEVIAADLIVTVRTALSDYPSVVHAKAIAEAVQDTVVAARTRGGRGYVSCMRYLRKALGTQAERCANEIARRRADEMANTALMRKRMDGVRRGGTPAAHASPMTDDDIWAAAEAQMEARA